jgi:hypothetical protein
MKRFLKRAFLGVVPAALTALVLGVPTAAPTDVQSVNLSCNDSTNLTLALDATALTQLADAVSAINLFPAGDPALACGLTQSTTLTSAATPTFSSVSSASSPTTSSSSGNGNGPHDFAVGGGQYLTSCQLTNFSFSAHVPANTPATAPQPGAGGTFNISVPATSACGEGSYTVKIDCVSVSGNRADFTGPITHTHGTGGGGFFGADGVEVAVTAFDNTPLAPDQLSPEGGIGPVSGPCDFLGDVLGVAPIMRGNISVHDN